MQPEPLESHYAVTAGGRVIYLLTGLLAGALAALIAVYASDGTNSFVSFIGSLAFALLLFVGSLKFVYEGLRPGIRFTLGPQGIEYRGLLHKLRIAWDDIESYDLSRPSIHVYLVLRLRNGRGERLPLSGLRYRQFMKVLDSYLDANEAYMTQTPHVVRVSRIKW